MSKNSNNLSEPGEKPVDARAPYESKYDYILKIFSTSFEDGYSVEYGKNIPVKVQVRFANALNNTKARVDRWYDLKTHKKLLIIPGNPRSTGMFADVCMSMINTPFIGKMKTKFILTKDKWENIILALELVSDLKIGV